MFAPLVLTAIYLGGAGADDCDDISVDRAGYLYLACHSSSVGFTGAESKDFDAYIVKFDPKKSELVYAARIGGSSWDAAFRVVVDTKDRVWVSGTTQSKDFPLEKCYFGCGAINAFAARVDAEGKIEYLAVIGDATGEGLVAAPDGKVYLAGTKSPSEEKHSAFVVEIEPGGAARMLTFGPGTASGIAIDGRGALFATGFSGQGAFVSRVDLAAWKQTALRSISGAGSDRARAVALDRAGRPHVLGTASPGFAGKRRVAGQSDVFLAGFDAKLNKLRYVRLFGGSSQDSAGFNGESLKLDSQGRIWIAGLTTSKDLHAQGYLAGADDGFVASFAPDGRRLRLATYFGGTGAEILEGLAITPDGTVWSTGLTASRGLGVPDHHGGRSDAILVKLIGGQK